MRSCARTAGNPYQPCPAMTSVFWLLSSASFVIDILSTPFSDLTAYSFLLQGVAMPAMNNILSKWVPVSERSRSLSLVYSGMYLGSVTGLAFSPLLIHKFGWPSVFYSFGSLGAVWFTTWATKVLLSSSVSLYISNSSSVAKIDFSFHHITSEFIVRLFLRHIVPHLKILESVQQKRSLLLVKAQQASLLKQFHGN